MVRLGPHYVLGILHPAFISRGQFGKGPLQVHYLRRARRLATLCSDPEIVPPELVPMDPSSPPAGSLPRFLAPRTMADLDEWARGDLRQGVTVDVEAAGDHIRAVGFARISDLVPLVVPFRRQGGGTWWKTREDLLGAVAFVDRILGDPAVGKVFHFGQSYDLPRQLERAGFVVRGYGMDTAFLAHLAYPETPKGLQVQATWRLGMGVWKHLARGEVDEKEETT